MRTRSLELVDRLSGIHETRAAETVATTREAVGLTRDQIASLRTYQAGLAPDSAHDQRFSGQMLHARAAFADLSETAAAEAGTHLRRLDADLHESLSLWTDAHQQRRVVSERLSQARNMDEREKRRRADVVRQSAPPRLV